MTNGDEKKVVRNATIEDIEKMKKKEATEGVPASKVKSEEKKEEKKGQVIDMMIKPKTSVFEPDPFPIKLPSGNKVVQSFLTSKNEIYVKRMGSIEEGLFMKTMGIDDPKIINATLDSVIDNCIKSRIESGSLSLIDKFAVFFKILDITYGKLPAKLQCNECKTEYEEKIDLIKDIQTKYLPSNYEYPHPIEIVSYKDCKLTWYVKYPTMAETQIFLDNDTLRNMMIMTDRIEGTIKDLDGEMVDVQKQDYEPIITNLNEDDRQKFKDFLNDFGSYGTQLMIDKDFCTNKNCGQFNKVQSVAFPFEAIFSKILSLK